MSTNALIATAFLHEEPTAPLCKDARMATDHQQQVRRDIQRLLDRTGLAASDLAQRAGVAATTVTRFMNKPDVKHTPSSVTVAKLRAAAESFLRGRGVQAASTVAASPDELHLPAAGVLARDIPVYGLVEGGQDGIGELDLATDLAFDWVRRPPGLANKRTAFALYVSGESMAPWREPGQIVFVHPDRPAAPGSYAVIILKPLEENGPRRALVKRFVAQRGGSVILEQFNPRDTIILSADDVLHIWRVVDWQEAMGFI